jgi:hypothetical protein
VQILEGDVTHSDGSATAVGAGAVIAAGAVAPATGYYKVSYDISALGPAAAGQGVIVEHRNAANSGTTRILGGCSMGSNQYGEVERLYLAVSERVRAIGGPAAGAASTYVAARITLIRVG